MKSEPTVRRIPSAFHVGSSAHVNFPSAFRFGSPALAVVSALFLVDSASAQAVRGEVSERATGKPLADVTIVLLDSTNTSRIATLVDQLGRFVIAVPSPGMYRLRLDAVGFFSDTTPSFRVAGTDTVVQLVKFSRLARDLPPVVVSAQPYCLMTQDAGAAVATLWEEVRNALTFAERSSERDGYRFDLLQYERELDPQSHKVRRSRQWERIGMTGRPYESIAAESLAVHGYVRSTPDGTWYYAPDARTLLADAFIRTHCLKPAQASVEHPDLVGLAFEAMQQHAVSDVRGVLWLDAATSQLRFLDYRYTGLPEPLTEYGFGGHVEFARLPSGEWVVDRWLIRLPRMSRETRSMPSGLPEAGPPRLVPVTIDVVAGIIERGGEVKGRDRGRAAEVAHHALLEGSIFDSTANAPLADADVWLDMSGQAMPVRRTSTDAAGYFQMDSVPSGTYMVTVTHPRLDALGSFLAPVAVTLVAGHGVAVEIATPSLSSVVRSLCAGGLQPDAALVHGAVMRADSVMSVPGARVVARWQNRTAAGKPVVPGDTSEVAVTADATGHYTLCGMPRRTPVVLTATDARSRGNPMSVTLDSERIAALTLFAPIHSAEIAGRVIARDGRPLRSAEVRIVDADIAVHADSAGNYRIATVPAGTHVLEARLVGYAPVRQRIESRAFVTLALDFRLVSIAQVLQPVRRMANRDPFRTGFESRMKRNRGGRFLTNEDIRTSGMTRVTDMLARVPGLQRRMSGTTPVIEFTGRGTRTLSPRGCPVAYMVDGVPFEPAGFGIDGDIGLANVEAIEVYDAATTPAEFTRRDSACGVVLIWTRERSVVDAPADTGHAAPPRRPPESR